MMTQAQPWLWRLSALIGVLVGGTLLMPPLQATPTGSHVYTAASARLEPARLQSDLTIIPATLPNGQINVPYSETISVSGGVGQVQLNVEGLFPPGLSPQSTNEGIAITGTVTEPGLAEITAFAEDEDGNTAQREYVISFSEGGEVIVPTPTPDLLTVEDIQQTREAGARALLGEAQVEISDEIDALAIRTGPYTGASLKNLARPGDFYDVLGSLRPVGSRYTWYLIDYTRENPFDPELPSVPQQGWVSGRYADVSGFLPDIPTLQNPFDDLSLTETGVRGRSMLKNNIYRYPGGYTPLVTRFDEGSTFEVLGRTVFDRRNFTYWLLVRLDGSGAIGWTRYTPFVDIEGNIEVVPVY